MSKGGTQMEVPGTPSPDFSKVDAEVNEAVLEVSEAEKALRAARQRERAARAAAARARRS